MSGRPALLTRGVFWFRDHSRNPWSRRALFLAAASGFFIPNTRADSFYYRGVNGGNWFGAAEWLDVSNGQTVFDPAVNNATNASNAYLDQSGTNGISNSTVYFNDAYSSPGIGFVEVDSNNNLIQNSATTSLFANILSVGDASNGQYSQSYGTVTVSALFLGYDVGTVGQYWFSRGNLNGTSSEEIGAFGTGYFNQSGGTNSTGQLILGAFLGTSGTSLGTGSYSLSGGVLTVTGNETVGQVGGIGYVTQTGGTHSVGDNLYIGSGTGGGYFTLSNGASLTATNTTNIGSGGVGSFTQYGGTFTGGNIYVNGATSGTGTYTMLGGVLTANTVSIGSGTGGGYFTVSNGASLNATNSLSVGYSGVGTLTQYGGTVTTSNLYIGAASGGTGTYSMLGGVLTTGTILIGSSQGSVGSLAVGGTSQISANYIYVGTMGTGQYFQSGGTVNINGTGMFGLGVIFSGRSGVQAQGTMTGGTLSMPSSALALGFVYPSDIQGDAGASFNQTGGTINSGAGEYISFSRNAFFTQSGGSNVVGEGSSATNAFYLGLQSSYSGSYTISSGVFSSTNGMYIGAGGSGVFTQNGGTVTTGNAGIAVGATAGYLANDSYTLNGGVLSVGGSISLGGQTNGTFTQTAGSNTIEGFNNSWSLYVGDASLPGTYTLGGGVLTASNGTILNYGTFTQTGGTHRAGKLTLASPATGYSLSNGALLINGQLSVIDGTFTLTGTGSMSANTELLGSNGAGQFNQLGGSNYATYSLTVGSGTGSGSYNMSGGTLYTASAYFGDYHGGVFNLSGGTFTANAIFLYNGGGFSQTASSSVLNATTFSQSGGTASGTIQNLGTYEYYSGAFNGQLINQGAILQYAPWTLSNGIYNQSTTALSIHSFSMTLNGTGLLNDGTVSLSTNLTATTEHIGFTNTGTFAQSSYANTTPSLYIGSSNGVSGTYSLSGGVLFATNVGNYGQFIQSGGLASFGVVSGTGTMALGGSAELTNVIGFQQNTITIGSNGHLAVATNTTAATNSVTTLSITGSGQLDLANNNLLTNTSPSAIRQYLVNGYSNGTWNGTGGISSTNAANDHTFNGAKAIRALGYTSGTSAVGMALGLASNQTLVKFTIYGDATLDGTVDISDLNIVVNNYLAGSTWDTGDFYYSGTTDISDLNVVLNNYLGSAPSQTRAASLAKSAAKVSASTAHTLTGTVSPDAFAKPAFNTLYLFVDVSGDVQIIGNNSQVGDTQITSASNGLITANWHDLKSQGYSNWSDTAKKSFGIGEFDTQFAATGDFALINDVDYGDIYNTTPNQGLGNEDLVFKYGVVDPNTGLLDTLTGSVYYFPEPTALSLVGVSALGLLARRRRAKETS